MAQSTFTGFLNVWLPFFRLISIPLGSPFFPGFEPYDSKNKQCIDELSEFSDGIRIKMAHRSLLMDWWCPQLLNTMAMFMNQKSCLLHLSACFQQPRHRSAAVRASTSWQATVPTAISAPIATFLMRNLGGSHDGLGDLDQWYTNGEC